MNTTPETEQLAQQIRELRLSKNVSQNLLAQHAGVSLRALQNLEAGHGSLATFLKVTKALGRQQRVTTALAAPAVRPMELLIHGKHRERATRQTPAKAARKRGSTKRMLTAPGL